MLNKISFLPNRLKSFKKKIEKRSQKGDNPRASQEYHKALHQKQQELNFSNQNLIEKTSTIQFLQNQIQYYTESEQKLKQSNEELMNQNQELLKDHDRLEVKLKINSNKNVIKRIFSS